MLQTTMKISKALNIFAALQALSAIKLPTKTAYRVARATSKFRPEIVTFEETKLELAKSFGELTEDGQGYRVLPENQVEFATQINSMAEEEITVEFPTITIEDLNDVEIEANTIEILMDIFILEKPEEDVK